MTEVELIAIRKRCDAATPLPWKHCKSIHGNQYRYVQIGKEEMYSTLELKPEDARFIAQARADIPRLLDAIEKLRRVVKKVDDTLRVPAAEYVPAIGDVFSLIDEAKLFA